MHRVIEVATLLNVSKVTIYKKMESYKQELKGHIKKQKSITYLDDEAVEIIKNSLIENGVLRDQDLQNNQGTVQLTEQVENLMTYGEYLEDELSHSVMANLKDLEILSDFLENQISIKKSMLAQKDEQLKQYKELNQKNKESIKSLEALIRKVEAFK